MVNKVADRINCKSLSGNFFPEDHIKSLMFKLVKQDGNFVYKGAWGDIHPTFGVNVSDIAGRRLQDIFSEEVVRQKLPFYEKCWEGEEVKYSGMLEQFSFLVFLVPVKDNGCVTEISGTVMDITNLKKNEDKLFNSEKLALVGQLAAGIAHEIRNPLTSLMGFTKILLELNKDQQLTGQYLGIMQSELERIRNIVNEYMQLAKPQIVAGEWESVCLELLIRDVLRLEETQALMKSIEFDVHIEAGMPPIRGKANKLKQVFINLIQNAIESMERGTIKITLSRYQEEMVKVSIADKGCGIPEEKLSNLFTPFYTTKANGTGLGLSVCKKIIDDHQGRIEIRSMENGGTIASVMLPIQHDNEQS